MDRIMLLDVSDPQEGFDGTVVAQIELTVDLAKYILSCAKLAKQLKTEHENFAQLVFYSSAAEYYDEPADVLTTDQTDDLTEEVPVFLTESPFLVDPQRTAYDRIVFDEEGVWWKTCPKHTDATAYTSKLRYEEVERFLSEEA